MYRTGKPQQKAHSAASTFIDKGLRILEEQHIPGRLRGGSIVKLDLQAESATAKGVDSPLKSDITDFFNSQAIPAKSVLCLHLLQRGIATLEGSFFIFSAAHTRADINRTLGALADSLDAMKTEGLICT
jgi:glutamate-1-semialdehyde aminotransferase